MNTRRNFLKLIAGTITFFSFAPMSFAKEKIAKKVKKIALPLSKIGAVKEVGGSEVVEVKSKALLLIRDKKDTVKAIDATCTHEGCAVEYNSKAKKIKCPCHGSEFNLDGKVLKGPAAKPLPTYKSHLSGDRVIIELI